MPQPPLNRKSPGKLKKNRIFYAVLAFLLVVGFFFWLSSTNQKKDVAPVNVSVVTQGDITQSVAATGRVVPNFEVEIKGKGSGKIISLPHQVSDYVRKGDLLVALDPIDEVRQVQQSEASLNALQERVVQSRTNYQVARQDLQTEIDKAKSNLEAAQAKAKEAQAQRNRLQQLVAGDFISQQEYEAGIATAVQAQTDVQNAQTRFNELKTQQYALNAKQEDIEIAKSEAGANRMALLQAEQKLAETRIYAPISGYITSQNGQIGQIVASGISNVGGGTSIMTLADLSRIFVLASVDESDIGQVRNGETVKITVDAFPGETFIGRVVQVAPKGVNTSDVVTFEVKIEVISPNKTRLKPEMTANTEIIISQRNHVMLVPSEAISLQQGKRVASVVTAGNKIIQRPVTVGINNGIQTEILSGLKPGDKVVVAKGGVSSEWRQKGGGGNSAASGARGQRRAGAMMMGGGKH